MPDHEKLTFENVQAIKVEDKNDANKTCILPNATTLYLQEGESGAIVQGIDRDGWAAVYRFRGVKCDDLVVKARLIDPNSPAGVTSKTSAPATPPTK